MERYGKHDFYGAASTDDSAAVWKATQEPLLSYATTDPDGFVAELARAVLPAGGWAVLGASRTVWNLLSTGCRHPDYAALMDASIKFQRESALPPMRVSGHDWARWVAQGGTVEGWLPRIPPPAPDEARLTPLRPGEARRLAQLEARPDSNVVLARLTDGGVYQQLVDARHSDDDPTRSQSVLDVADSQYALYLKIGLALQSPPFWADPELVPFIPLPRPTI